MREKWQEGSEAAAEEQLLLLLLPLTRPKPPSFLQGGTTRTQPTQHNTT